MSPIHPLFPAAPPGAANRWPRRLVAALLRRASHALDQAAAGLLHTPAPSAAHRREFGADGALYEDGRLLGFLDGVRRL